MNKDRKLFWMFAILLVLLSILRVLPIGDWVSEHYSLTETHILIILVLNIMFWGGIIYYLKKRRKG